ncbi:molecular chaperone [Sphingomonas sp. LY29]|uniref:molecular chaperone n=1 Tax=Sphingomonas sp. LY29 TaxID=3095341 RepID=UPI002D7914F8|nr:molecular chaperone [Sphingomonas sp. LY29]WRP24942.1 molecular chaperone [Sphingomonas sp. LY29]
MRLSILPLLARATLLAPALLLAAPAANAGVGDLLVAPTRIVLDGRRGTEVILNNIGDEVATYRISVELRRMTPDGRLTDVTAPSDGEKAAQEMILFAPRRVTLPPNQPQAIRLSARAPQGLADGEYRAHLLFRAVPPPRAAAAPGAKVEGVAFQLTPIYGVTIPVIVRLGNLEAKAGIANVRKVVEDGQPAVAVDLSRSGKRSTFGEVRVLKAGVSDPIAVVRGVAVYTELDSRSVSVPIDPKYAAQANGAVTVQYIEPTDTGPVTIAETSAVLR